MSGKTQLNRSWADLVEVRGRYQRSINLEKDALTQGALQGYVITPLVKALLGRVIDGYGSGMRAWSITGPYGAGKSAFAVFLTELLGGPVFGNGKEAKDLLKRADTRLVASLGLEIGGPPLSRGLCPILASGERRSADVVLLRALEVGLAQFWEGPGSKPGILKEVSDACRKAEKGERIPAREVVSLFESAASKVASSNYHGAGLLVLLDEAGKLLEHASQDPVTGDVHVLQELAEAANRSGDSPIVFVTLLHQAFDQYASRLSAIQRKEWAKVQGRFEDLPFVEEPQELLFLIGEAIEKSKTPSQALLDVEVTKSVSALAVSDADRNRLKDRLTRTLPLHPATALVLGPLFRSGVAQNQRSLFAFLSSNEPHGFKAFLAQKAPPALYRPDELFDYVAGALGDRMYGHSGKQWALIWSALQRLPRDAEELDGQLLKCIGVLSIFGDSAGVRADDVLLRAIYGEGVDESIARLKSRSLIIHRKFRAAWQLWEGSDIDLDSLVGEAMSQLRESVSLAKRMTLLAPPRPMVARRHLLETGTLRYFEFRYVDTDEIHDAVPTPSDDADGAILLVLEPDPARRASLTAALQQGLRWQDVSDSGKPVLVGVPPQASAMLGTGMELAALERVREQTPDLRNDPVALRELSSREAECEKRLRGELRRLVSGEVEVPWFESATQVEVSGPRDFAALLSRLCDRTYGQAPHIHNELVNRRTISSSAAAVRQKLLASMIEGAKKPNLGFEGSPPEFSIFRSVLEVNGLHRKEGEEWAFREPVAGKGSLLPAWREVERLLDDAHELRVKVSDIYSRLRRPPYGMKDGVLPIVFVSALLAWRDQTALYDDEEGFISNLNPAVFERLVRSPAKFEVQRFEVEGGRAALFEKLAHLLSAGSAQPARLLPVVRRLIRVVRDLPDYARITKSVSPRSQAVREVLLRAKEPAPLIFNDLPAACGFPPFKADATAEAADAFVSALRTALIELQGAYGRLLERVESDLRTAFNLAEGTDAMRRELLERAARATAHATDPKLKAFLLRATDEMLDREGWLASLGTLFAGKPPESWHDQDAETAGFSLAQIARRFSAAEAIALGANSSPPSDDLQLIRVSVAEAGRGETERVVPLRASDAKGVRDLGQRLREFMVEAGSGLPREAILAALGLAAKDLISQLEPTHGNLKEGDS